MAMLALFAIGTSPAATPLLNGPTMARTLLSETNCVTFLAPWATSWTPLTASSSGNDASVKHASVWLEAPQTFPASLTASLAAFWGGRASEGSTPLTGRSMPTLMVPLILWPPVVVVPQAASATLATASPASNFGNLIYVLLPNGELVLNSRRP